MQVLRRGWTIVVAVALCGSCSKNNDISNTTNNNYTTINNISQVVGPQGAHIGTPDTAQIDIPAGALTQDVTIELGEVTQGGPSVPAGVTKVSGVWALTPHGQTFAKDVVVTLPHTAGSAQVGMMRAEVDGSFSTVAPSDVTSGTVAAKTTSFSFFVAVYDADAGAGGSAGGGGAAASGGVAGQGSGAFGGGGSGGAGLSAGAGGSAGAAGSGGGSCAGTTMQAEPVPLDVLLMVDGMQDDATQWQNVKTALQSFVTDASHAGMGVGAHLFAVSGGSCDGSVYATPAVPMAPLPGNANPFQAWLQSVTPVAGRPIEDVLRGMTSFYGQWAPGHPDRDLIGLLVVGGPPSSCDTSYANLATVAANGLPVPTYLLDVGATPTPSYAQVASAASKGASVSTASSSSAITTALDSIVKAASACSYAMPQPDAGVLDPSKVNLEFTPSTGAPQTLKRGASAGNCATGDWRYDDDVAPTRILLCPTQCSTVAGDSGGKLDVVLGCTGA